MERHGTEWNGMVGMSGWGSDGEESHGSANGDRFKDCRPERSRGLGWIGLRAREWASRNVSWRDVNAGNATCKTRDIIEQTSDDLRVEQHDRHGRAQYASGATKMRLS